MKVHFYTFLFLLATVSLSAQETILDFEDAGLEVNQFDNGVNNDAGLFTFSGVNFPNVYDTDWDYWAAGWAVSAVQDSTDNTYANIYSAYPFSGNNGSTTYLAGQYTSTLSFADGLNRQVNSVAVTNSSFALLIIRDGDPNGFSKTFGGDTGDDPDYFRLTIKGYDNQSNFTDSVDFYLADYRFDDNSQDYIVNTWETVDLSSLGEVNTLEFSLKSTDENAFGILTPAFYCIDDLNFEATSSTNEVSYKQLDVYPNPASSVVFLEKENNLQSSVRILDLNGSVVYNAIHSEETIELNTARLSPGVYHVIVKDEKASYSQKLIIQ